MLLQPTEAKRKTMPTERNRMPSCNIAHNGDMPEPNGASMASELDYPVFA